MEISTATAETARVLMNRADALVAEIVGRITQDVPSCAADPDALHAAVHAELRSGLAAALGMEPDPDGRGGTADRNVPLAPGIALSDVLQAYRVGADIVWAAFAAECAGRGIPAEEFMPGATMLWEWVHAANLRIARAATGGDGGDALAVPAKRLKALLLGASRAALPGVGAALPFRARLRYEGAGRGLGFLDSHLARDPAGHPLLTVVDGDTAGLLRDRPALAPPTWTIGLGEPAAGAAVAAEFARAGQALRAACHFRLGGVWTLEELGLRGRVVTEPATGELLWRARLAPVEDAPRGAEVLEAVGAYLDHDMRVDLAARALFLHPNTLRNRLRRFEEITGTRLRDPGDVAEVWWAFAHRGLRDRPDSGQAG